MMNIRLFKPSLGKEELENINPEENNPEGEDTSNQNNNIISVSGMYKDWFLDYASYVILERAVPSIEDGVKGVKFITTVVKSGSNGGKWIKF